MTASRTRVLVAAVGDLNWPAGCNAGPGAATSRSVRRGLVDIGLAPESALAALGYRHYDRLAKIRRG